MIREPGDYHQQMNFDGRERSYVLHVPPAFVYRKPLPLVVVLHGGGGNAQYAMEMTNMSAKADQAGFLVVYPNGTGSIRERLLTWNSWNCCGYALDQQIDDVGFIRTLLERLQQGLKIDSKRIYVTGFSNGGMETYRLGCELADQFAAIAPVAGALNTDDCRPSSPLSVIIFHGTADEHILYDGGKPVKQMDRHERVDKPVSYAVSFWVQHNACESIPQHEENGNILQDVYSGCRAGTEVILYTIQGGVHAWPGGKKVLLGDEPTQEISATDLMWDFFMKHPKT
jgi:polyhydroxybutyrate depolymerase